MSARVTAVPVPSGHLLPLDGIRGLAVLIVIVHNSAWIAQSSEHFLLKLFSAVAASGWLGVELFFVLSGFLITGILLDQKGKPRYFRSFYLRRALRIFPLYYLFIAVAFLVVPLVAWSPAWIASVRENQWSYWVYLSNWFQPFGRGIEGLAHIWSLAVEEQFYLAWPLIVLLLSRRGLEKLCLALIMVTPFIRLALRVSGLPLEAGYMFTIARWDALAAGALVAALLRDEAGRQSLARWKPWAAGLAGVALVALVAVNRGFHQDDLPVQVAGQSLILILSASLIAYAVSTGARAPRKLQAFLSLPALRTLGKYSYAMYILHFPLEQSLSPILGEAVRGADTPWRLGRLALYIGVILALTLLAAMLSWRLIERPFLDLKDRIAPRVGGTSSA